MAKYLRYPNQAQLLQSLLLDLDSFGPVVDDEFFDSIAGSSGSLTATLAPLTSTAAGTVPVSGAGAGTLAALSDAAAGAVTVQGAVTKTLDALAVVGVGTDPVAGALAQTLDGLGIAATGEVGLKAFGALAVVLDALGLSSSGTVTGEGIRRDFRRWPRTGRRR
jgi:hypothetical protein